MYHGNDRLINLAVGAVVVIVFLLIGRLKRSLRKPPGETYRCGRCRWTLQKKCRDPSFPVKNGILATRPFAALLGKWRENQGGALVG